MGRRHWLKIVKKITREELGKFSDAYLNPIVSRQKLNDVVLRCDRLPRREHSRVYHGLCLCVMF